MAKNMQSNGQIPFNTPRTPYQNNLQPAAAPFQPRGDELQRFAYDSTMTPPTPSTTYVPSPEMEQLHHFMVGNHADNLMSIMKVERGTRRNSEALQEHKAVVRQDLRTLQAQIDELKAQVANQSHETEAANGESSVTLGVTTHADQVRRPPREWIRRFGARKVAEVYLEQADDHEQVALKLREYAEIADPGCLNDKGIHLRLLDGPKSSGGFPAESDTPTHMPLRRARPEVKAETPSSTKSSAPENFDSWLPLAVRQMPTFTAAIPENAKETFTWEFLNLALGGTQWSPGFYFVSGESSVLRSKTYWLLEGCYEPYLPSSPGQHGAKLTAFFNSTASADGAPEVEDYMDAPVFICADGATEYTYFGTYSQLRFSDKLDFDRVQEQVPEKVRKYWADLLADPGRPAWVTQSLMEHFWPKPTYDGPIPTDSALNTPATAGTVATEVSVALERRVQKALEAHAIELKDWQKDAKIRVSHLTAENVMKAFDAADADLEPGLRLWWEYLQCVGYDEGFYDKLVQLKKTPKAVTKPAVNGPAKTTRPALGKTVHAKSGVETVRPSAAAAGPETPKATVKQSKPVGLQNGDLQAAKHFQEHATPAGGKRGGSKREKGPPPHLRSAKK